MRMTSLCLPTLLLTGLGALAADTAPPIRQWRVAELSFQAQDTYQGTPLGVRFGATFTGPDGRQPAQLHIGKQKRLNLS